LTSSDSEKKKKEKSVSLGIAEWDIEGRFTAPYLLLQLGFLGNSFE